MYRTTMISLIGLLLLGCSKGKPAEAPHVLPPAPIPVPTEPAPLRTISVRTANELKAALLDARPGDAIELADGVYDGRFVIEADRDGTAAHPVILRGSAAAVLDGGSIETGYVLHLQADHWNISGFSIRNGLKGIMTDRARYNRFDSLQVSNIGEEGIHLRAFSSRNTIAHCSISNTGLHTPDYGEGVYLGSAKSNWPVYTNGAPDRSDSNEVLENRIGPGVAAECIDIKEGSTGGLISGNIFNSDGIQGANAADSWMDVKGNYYRIENNAGVNPGGTALVDGFQVHVAVPGWGNYNMFRGNRCVVNAAGYGILVRLNGSNGPSVGNKVYADNSASGAGGGLTNIPVTQ
ncbi:MAG: coagulation factor 5/8 type domain-containing protein [Chitinophagaceae bacterium]|nr:MAG: coagulation factor 5/8 type domain-containing protein [Chitinophagaceae bacterium]